MSPLQGLFKPSKKAVPPTSSACSRALALPEILASVFSYLSPFLIRHTVYFVSQQWLSVARLIAPLQLKWFLNVKEDEHTRILRALPNARSLCLLPSGKAPQRSELFPNIELTKRLWGELLTTMEKECAKQKQKSTLREVEIRSYLVNLPHFSKLLPHLSTISILRLREVIEGPDQALLHSIFKTCPTLEALHIEGSTFSKYYEMIMLESEYQDKYLHLLKLPMMPKMHLKTMVVHNLLLTHGVVDWMVDACPRLVELKIVGARQLPTSWSHPSANDNAPEGAADRAFDDAADDAPSDAADVTAPAAPVFIAPPQRNAIYSQIDRSALFRRISSGCPKLKRFHFSTQPQTYAPYDFDTLLGDAFQGMTELSISQYDLPSLADRFHFASTSPSTTLSPAPGTNPPTHLDYLTVLELLPFPPCGADLSADYLQNYLRAAVKLKHLIAPNVVISAPTLSDCVIEHTDDPINPQSIHHRRVWACRNLSTLHISFQGSTDPRESKEAGLLMYGYLTRVCPRLVDLQIRRSTVDLTQDAGMCLLTRLKSLERLVIRTGKCVPMAKHDMEWLRPLPAIVQKIMSMGYAAMMKAQPSSLPQMTSLRDHDNAIADSSGIDWTHFGKTSDLAECAQEQSRENLLGKRTLPLLECFLIYSERDITQRDGDSLRRFVGKMRPDLNVDFSSYKKFQC